jgi:hypothetical protein
MQCKYTNIATAICNEVQASIMHNESMAVQVSLQSNNKQGTYLRKLTSSYFEHYCAAL